MDAELATALVLVAPVLLIVVGVGRAAWRTFVANEEAEPGGSDGRQLAARKR